MVSYLYFKYWKFCRYHPESYPFDLSIAIPSYSFLNVWIRVLFFLGWSSLQASVELPLFGNNPYFLADSVWHRLRLDWSLTSLKTVRALHNFHGSKLLAKRPYWWDHDDNEYTFVFFEMPIPSTYYRCSKRPPVSPLRIYSIYSLFHPYLEHSSALYDWLWFQWMLPLARCRSS